MSPSERLAKLSAAGVSVWLDQIRRSLITEGELARLVREDALRGVTANPSIFEKAILGSDDYEQELEEMVREGIGAFQIYERIAIRDVQLAADTFADTYESGPRWEGLRHAGAAVQRPLWASTGVKNPHYADTKYVEELVGADTVNTMPLATLEAFADHGNITGPTAEHDPTPDLEALQEAGIDLRQVTDELLADGIDQFEDATVRLIGGIDRHRADRLAGMAGRD
jgi:transaldolase